MSDAPCLVYRPCCCHVALAEEGRGEVRHCWGCGLPKTEHSEAAQLAAGAKERSE